jgi:hypothetical protein
MAKTNVVYRLENSDGEGPFRKKNGEIKIVERHCGARIVRTNKFFSFANVNSFLSPDYLCFLKSDEYSLYKIVLYKPRRIKWSGEVMFSADMVEEKILIGKELIKRA